MLSNNDLQNIGEKMNIPLSDSIGFKNELPKRIKPGVFYITNLEDDEDERGNNGGSHWVSFQVREPNNGNTNAAYFDSYGKPPPLIIKKAIKESFGDIPVWVNKKDVQSLVADTCGYWCLAFGHYVNDDRFRTKSLKRDAEEFVSFFDDLNESNNFMKNEWILKHFFMDKNNIGKSIELPTG